MLSNTLWTSLACLALLGSGLGLAGCIDVGQIAQDAPDAPGPDPPAAGAPLKVIYVDVGQGDGTLWILPDGTAVVYDCGPAASSPDDNPMVRALRAEGFAQGSTLRALVASHGHLDHIGGCEEILDEYHVQHLYETWYNGTDRPRSYQRFQADLLDEVAAGATLHVAAGATDAPPGSLPLPAGTTLQLGGVSAEILWPAGPTGSWDDVAKHSFVVRLSYGDVDFCFQGDIEHDDEADLAQRFGDRDCDVYLVGHHGSRHASSAPWIAAMAPKLAVASVGKNSYGHPHPDALGRLAALGVPVLATIANGTISVTTLGVGFTVDVQRTGQPLDQGETSPDPTPAADAWIRQINADPPGPDNDNLGEEWVRIRNPTDTAMDLTGWSLLDAVDTTYNFPDDFALAAGAEVKVRTGTGTDSASDLYWGRGSAVWNNSGDVAVLYDDHGGIVGELAY